jgi:hypothetical protein
MVTRYLDIAERPLRQAAGAVIHTRHTSVAGEASGRSGSTGWDAGEKVKGHVTLIEPKDGSPPDPDARVIRRVKTNWARIGGDIEMHWRDGVLIPDYVDEHARPSAEEVFLMLLDRQIARGSNLSANSQAPNYAPGVFAKMSRMENWGYDKPAFTKALRQLLEVEHVLEVQTYWKNSDERHRLVRAPAGSTPRHSEEPF